MAAYLDKERINTAITDSTHFDLSHVHITTGNFMQLQPIYNKEMVPGEKIDVNVETFARMNPLPVPTFGRANIKNRAYFVPFRTIFRGWNDFITDAPHTDSDTIKPPYTPVIPQSVPIVRNDVLVEAFRSMYWNYYGYNQLGLTAAGSSSYDIVLRHTLGNSYMKFTPAGRIGLKIVQSLGYEPNWNIFDNTPFSALPLLALAKVYVDWYFPNAYTNNADYARLLALCNYDVNSTPLELTKEDVCLILSMTGASAYDSDYFVSAWDNPTQPGASKASDYKLVNLDYFGKIVSRPTSSTSTLTADLQQGFVTNNTGNTSNDPFMPIGYTSAPFISPMASGKTSLSSSATYTFPTPISQYLLHGLHALTDYLKRHQLVGSKAMDRYLARYGKSLPAEKMNRSVYLGSQMVPIQIGDVMSQTNDPSVSEGAYSGRLGDYAGKGLAYGNNGSFSYQTEEFGMFIVMSSIIPATGYYQGRNRLNTMHINRLDFWTPEFENIGTQPIRADELYVSNDGGSVFSVNASTSDSSFGVGLITEKIFGYTPRYAEYKVPFDQVTGNMRIPTLNGDASTNNGTAAWHLMRSFDDRDFVDASSNYDLNAIVHSLDFCYTYNDLGEYNRVFVNTDEQAPDQFTIIHQFNIGDYAPMKPLYDSYDWMDKGRKVTLDVNGVKHN